MVESRGARSVPVGERLRLEQRTPRPPCAIAGGGLGGPWRAGCRPPPVGSGYRNVFVAAPFSAHRLILESFGFQAGGAAVKVRPARRWPRLPEWGAEAHMI